MEKQIYKKKRCKSKYAKIFEYFLIYKNFCGFIFVTSFFASKFFALQLFVSQIFVDLFLIAKKQYTPK